MKKVIAIDFDGVLANTAVVKRAWLLRETGLDVALGKMDRSSLVREIGYETYRAMQKAVGFEDTLSAEPMEFMPELLGILAESWSVQVVTARPLGKLKWVSEWLARNRLDAFISTVVSSQGRKKVDVASELGALYMIDDDLRHFATDRGVVFILFGCVEPPPGLPEVRCAPDWRAVSGLLREYECEGKGTQGQLSSTAQHQVS